MKVVIPVVLLTESEDGDYAGTADRIRRLSLL